MDFIVANFQFSQGKQFGSLYYDGPATREDGSLLKVRQSADFRYFGKFAEPLSQAKVKTPLSEDDFYFIADYEKGKESLFFQTDLVGYEAVFIWKQDHYFIFSDDPIALSERILSAGFEINLDEEKVREYLFYGQSFFQDTIFTNTIRLKPACVGEISVSNGEITESIYDHFIMTPAYETPATAAQGAKECLKKYFSSHYDENTLYSIGMSGGLDSRVGAYFAKECGYRIKPIFIGVKKNAVGWRTNDVVRAEKVNSQLGFEPITYFDPRKTPLEEKVRYDALFAPCMTNNVSQNMGKLDGINVLIHAMMGGEAFGQLADAKIEQMDFHEFCLFLADRVSCRPRYKTSSATLRRLSNYFKIEAIAKKWIYCDPAVADELISPEHRKSVLERIEIWVGEQKAMGLTNLNIWHKYFYYRFAVMAKTGYYSTLNHTVPSLATYMNPSFVREILKWDPSFLLGVKVQKELLSLLGNLASLRSQTIECSVNDKSALRHFKKIFYVIERILRGGAMVTTNWFSDRQVWNYIETKVDSTCIGKKIQLKNKAWFCNVSQVPFALMKVAYIDNHLAKVKKIKTLE